MSETKSSLGANTQLQVLLLLLLGICRTLSTTGTQGPNICSKKNVLTTRTQCNSCLLSNLLMCPTGYRINHATVKRDCKFTGTSIGCSKECFKELTVNSCCPGYWGPDCIECPEEAKMPCSNNGVCSDGMGGNGTCTCKPGFSGTACEDCAENHYGATCSSVCRCVHGLCNSGIHGDGKCTCFSGYKGPNCDLALPECVAMSCPENSRCIEEALTGELVCRCMPGYQKSGDKCTSINPCLQSRMCHQFATCAHLGPNQHSCTCGQGYSGDGVVCVPIDPCQTDLGGCSADGMERCVFDGPGKSHCDCQEGFGVQPGIMGCVVKDLCKPNSCDKNAKCTTETPGEVTCTCLEGFLGNGKICFGNIMHRLNELNTEPGGQWVGQLGSAITLFGSLAWPLSNLGPFTIFVPINKGFKTGQARSLVSDKDKTKYLCNLHLVAGELNSEKLKQGDTYYTLTGKGGEVTSGEDKKLKIRLYGSRKKADVVQADIIASNGVIHLINKLMDSVAPTVTSEKEEDLMKVLSDNGKFAQFKGLLQKANMALMLEEPGPFTLFAPTGAAFDAMKEGHLQYLSSSEGSTKLLELLRNHVVPFELEVYNVVSKPQFVTKANQLLTINVTENGNVLVNGVAVVLEADVQAKNGRLYSLDGVLIPPSIQPLLPHRCDVTENNIVKGTCVSCFKVAKTPCPSGESMDAFKRHCVFRDTGHLGLSIPTLGCAPLCNETVTIPRCCQGFYGPDCSPCPGGFTVPCSGHGLCMDGTEGNGTCVCEPNFKGSRCQFCSGLDSYGPGCDKKCDCIHGECDNRVEADGRCKSDSCQNGYTGKYCERHTQACGTLVQFCHAHAECDFNGGAVKCVCKPGYQGDGITCLEADPCALPHRGGCSENAKCIKTGPRTHTCQCMTGWMADGDQCQAVNPCLLPERGNCQPNATCIYVGPGQSQCVCKDGFLGNGRECEAINPCVTENGACHFLASCVQLSGAWTCVCDAGWKGDGKVCYGNLEQELRSMPGVANFFRIVSDGYISRMMIYQNVTVLVPSTEAVGKMTPDERSYWTAKDNLPSLVRNHMIDGIYPLGALRNISRARITNLLKEPLPISTTNETTVIAGAAVTRANVMASNGLIHIIDKVLIPGKDLSEGLVAVLNQRPEFSLFSSYIIQHNLTDKIAEGFEYTVFAPTNDAIKEYLKKTASQSMDLNLTQYHIVPNQRLLRSDLEGGAYKDTMLGFSYQLEILPKDGKLYVNEALLNVSDVDTVKGVIHGLTAVLEIRLNRCDKKRLQITRGICQDCFHPLKKLCDEGAQPVSTVPRKCMFSRMYQGERLLGIGCRALCTVTTIVRKCCGGYFGEHCEPCPGPKAEPCFGNGVCVDGTNGTGVCQCGKGFRGTGCETCQTGKYGIHCDQDCVCRNGRCNDGLNGDGSCECDVGWRGVTCDEKITSKADELCNTIKCHTSANCVINPDGYKCVCAAGFEGNGTYCKAKDACAANNGGCSLNAKCKRTLPGRRDCVCIPGYSGDGLVCVEINPCLEDHGGCHANADCIHTGPNRTSCVCSQGYSGTGKTCAMIDLCRKNKGGCHRYAICNMTSPGVRKCTCSSSYIGDGLTCKGTVWRELQTRKLRDFYMGLIMTDLNLQGRGPFTVFAPDAEAFGKVSREMKRMISISSARPSMREKYVDILRYHVVSCHALSASDLTTPRNLTTLMGDVLHISSVKGSIFINNVANVTFSDDASSNGVIHVIDTVLVPRSISLTDEGPTSPIKFTSKGTPSSNLSDVANVYGYKTFYKLLEDTKVMSLMQDAQHKPVTVLLPSDATMAGLSQYQKDFLYNQHNRPHLLEYLKHHILPRRMVLVPELPHLEATRTLQGSELSFNCGGIDHIGEIYLNGGSCRIIQRHLLFNGGVAYGIDCLLAPPSLGGRCDTKTGVDITMPCMWCAFSKKSCPEGSVEKEQKACDLPMQFVEKNTGCQSICTINLWSPQCCAGYYGRDCLPCPGGAKSPCEGHGKCDDGHLGSGNCTCDTGFQGTACERCLDGHFGPQCKACNCSEHGACVEGLKGTGSCFCDQGWTGQHCETQLAEGPVCSPVCSPSGVCTDNNTCVCKPFYEGDGYNCTLADMCSTWNGGCAPGAMCSQQGEKVSCTCPKGHSGDGFSCQPVDPCASGENGGCHEHATCTMTGPGKKKCACKDDYLGDGLTCVPKEVLLDRCATENGQCHLDAKCTDLHFEDSTVGVFHYRSPKGQYMLNYTQAQEACAEKGATVATYTQLSYAQQAGYNLCAAGWLEQARVSYPTTYSNPKCGFGHVGIVDYGKRNNLSETWDTFCHRVKEVTCECKPGYVGDGSLCVGNLMQVLSTRPMFSNFLSQILNYSQISESGREFVKRLSNLTIQSTLFVPANDGLYPNQTLTHRDIEYHLSEGRALALKDLNNGSHIHTHLGHSLTVLGIADFLNPNILSSRYINDRFIIDSNIPASNGIIHVLQGPLIAPPPKPTLPVGHKAGMGIGVVLLVMVVIGVGFVGYHFYTRKTKPFQFHYFKDNEEEDSTPPDCNPSICNPMYVSAPDLTDHTSSDLPEDKHQVVDSGPYDLLQAS
ncbi:stabilin-2 [Osmerus eperlanus]|uniref:stabilin-2 n=1 Tax=Osmerus eperlanus TaxID=29151 RepID=UPI002E0EAA63